MSPDIHPALKELQEDIHAEIDKELKGLALELEVADIELLHGKITQA